MDPLENLCIVADSFYKQEKQENRTFDIIKYSEEFIGSPRTRRNKIISSHKFQNIILKIPELTRTAEIKGFFNNMSSYVLANIDTIYNFSKQENGYLIPQVLDNNYKYAILNCDIGHLEYLQYRLPESKGFINCIPEKDKRNLRFPLINIDTNCDKENLSEYINNIAPEGVDLVVGSKTDLISNSIKALKILKKGGIFITKIAEINLSTLYVLTLCFSYFSLFRPFLENENVLYVVCEGYSGNSIDIKSIFSESVIYPNGFSDYISSIVSHPSTVKSPQYNFYRCKALMNVE